jgi:hypothetical protein
MQFVKTLLSDDTTELLNFAHVKSVSVNSGDSSLSDITFTDDSVKVAKCELSILTTFLLPLLVKEDLAGNPL